MTQVKGVPLMMVLLKNAAVDLQTERSVYVQLPRVDTASNPIIVFRVIGTDFVSM